MSGRFVRSEVVRKPLPALAARFGVRSVAQLRRDYAEMVKGFFGGERFQMDPRSSWKHFRPDLSLPAYAGLVPEDGRAPIFNLFDVVGGGEHYSQRVTKNTSRDFRGGRLTYDEHDGTDFACPIGTPLCAAAPGTVVMIRDRWLRGGLTVAVDHGHGVVTQYTHCCQALQEIGTQVQRGDAIALSGAAGVDIMQFFPWIPPHIHFMVWVDGRPVDPFTAEVGAWQDPNAPQPASSGGEHVPDPSEVDVDAIREVANTCTDARIRQEIATAEHNSAALAALLEDALHHDSWAWPASYLRKSIRPPTNTARVKAAAAIKISLPLPAQQYTGCYFADNATTLPK